MQQMKTMMADPAVKARMRRMLEKLGADNPGLEGASKLATDDDALDSIFEKMQDPEVLERLQAMTKSEEFQSRVQKMTQDPNFMSAAGQYAEEMKDEVLAAHKDAADAAGGDDPLGLGLETGGELDEEDDEEA